MLFTKPGRRDAMRILCNYPSNGSGTRSYSDLFIATKTALEEKKTEKKDYKRVTTTSDQRGKESVRLGGVTKEICKGQGKTEGQAWGE